MRALYQTIPTTQPNNFHRSYAKVYGRNAYGEYVVRSYPNGILHAAADYFTNCLDDACHTANAFALCFAGKYPGYEQ